MGLLGEEIEKNRRAVEQNPQDFESYKKLGQSLQKKGSINDAIAAYAKAVELYPSSAELHHHLGAAFAMIQEWEKAIACYLEALKLHTKSPIIYNHLGVARAHLKRWDRAIESYRKAVELNPDYATYHFNLGEAFYQIGDLKAAITSWQKAVGLHPKFRKALRLLKEAKLQKAEQDLAYERQKQTALLPSEFEGCLDAATSDFIFGWARHISDPDRLVFVDVAIGDTLIGVYPANKFRQDLADAFKTHGFHKFELKVPPSFDSEGRVEVSVKISETGQHIKKSPVKIVIGTKGKKHQSFDKNNVAIASQLVYRKPPHLEASRSTVKPAVGIIVLNLNGSNLLDELFESFLRYNSYTSIELIIVDHGSVDNSIEICQKWAHQLPIQVIPRGENYGFSESNNFAARQTRAPLLLFMNNDITLCQDIIPELVDLMRDESVGVAGLKLLDIVQGRSPVQPPIQHLGVQFNFYTPFEPFYPFEVRYAPQMLNFQSTPWRVPVVTGALMMCRREEYFQLGGFHEEYFYGYEDVDLCLLYGQMFKKQVICANNLTAFHHRGYSRFSGSKSESFRAKFVNNKEVLERRFGYYVRRRHFKDFFETGMYWTSHPLKVGFAVTNADVDAAAGDYFTAMELGEQLVREYGWEVFYLSEGPEWYDVDRLDVLVVMRHEYDMRLLENAKPTLVKIAWARNWFEVWAASVSAQHYDCFWCSSQKAVDYISKTLSKSATLLRIATNPERFSMETEFDENLKSDYCFTGSFWNSPREIVNCLNPERLPFEFALYGENWDKIEKFQKYDRGLLPYEDLPKVYASTKIVVDDANAVTKEWGSANSRVFDAIASGALVITNGQLGNEDAFDGLLPTYNSPESLEKLLREYLENEDLRRQKIAQLQQIVRERHTYRHRAQTVFATLREKMTQKYRIGIKIGVPDWHQAEEWGDYHFAKAMKRAFERLGHSVRIDILPEWENPKSFGDDVAIAIRGLSRYQPQSHQINLMWNISHPDKVSVAEYEQYDRVFVASTIYAETLQKQVKVPVQPLLQCTDPSLFYPDETGDEKVGEVLFVGNSRKVYRKIVRDAVEAGLKVDVYGTNWEPLLPEGYLKGEHIPNDVLRRYYTKCGVLLNDHWDTMREQGFLSNRLFDAAACGATIVSDKIPGCEVVFGDRIATYQSSMELDEVVRRSLELSHQTQAERLQFARHIREYHTFERRVDELLEAIEELDRLKMLKVP